MTPPSIVFMKDFLILDSTTTCEPVTRAEYLKELLMNGAIFLHFLSILPENMEKRSFSKEISC
jgi:hypothetical protein